MSVAWKAELDRLSERDGKLHQEQIVAEAVDPNSPLHEHFTWDDDDAAHQWRLHEAEVLIRRYTIVIGEDAIRVRRFVNIGVGRGYERVEDVLGDEDIRGQFLAKLASEVASVTAKYRRYQFAAEVVDALEDAIALARGEVKS